MRSISAAARSARGARSGKAIRRWAISTQPSPSEGPRLPRCRKDVGGSRMGRGAGEAAQIARPSAWGTVPSGTAKQTRRAERKTARQAAYAANTPLSSQSARIIEL